MIRRLIILLLIVGCVFADSPDKNNGSQCFDDDSIIYPFNCTQAIAEFGCDKDFGIINIGLEACPKSCDLCDEFIKNNTPSDIESRIKDILNTGWWFTSSFGIKSEKNPESIINPSMILSPGKHSEYYINISLLSVGTSFGAKYYYNNKSKHSPFLSISKYNAIKTYLDGTPKFKKFKGLNISTGYSIPMSKSEVNHFFLNIGISFTNSTKVTNDWGQPAHIKYGSDNDDESIGVYNSAYIPFINVELKKSI